MVAQVGAEKITLGDLQMRLADAHLIPIDQLAQRISEIPADRPILVYCAVGSRSSQVFNFLARRGFNEVYNLDGGTDAWSRLVDPSVPRY